MNKSTTLPCGCHFQDTGPSLALKQCDMHLHADETLEALKNMLANYKEFYDDVYAFGNSEVMLAAQAAVARATGEDQP